MLHSNRSTPGPAEGCLSATLSGLKGTTKELGSSSARTTEAQMLSLYRRFVATAILITLTFGTFWGVSILTKAATTRSFGAPDPAQIQAHAHAQVFGWIGLLIMGVAYFLYPKFKSVDSRNTKAIVASYWMMTTGIVLRAICQPFSENALAGAAVAVSAAVELGAAVMFGAVMFGTYRRSQNARHISDVFIFTSIAWLIVALAINLFTMLQVALTGNPIVGEVWNLRRMNVEVFGFIITMILGVGTRILPRLLGLRDMKYEVGIIVAGLYTVGVYTKAFGEMQSLGSLLICGAAALYLAEINPFASSARNSTASSDHLGTWAKVAFFWLIASGAMMLSADVYELMTGMAAPHAWVGAYRHAVTVGFITTLAVGIALRTAPLFHGTTLHSQKLVTVTFWLLVIGNLSRVVFQIFTLTKHPVAYAVAGMSGYLELSALLFFGWNIYKTFSKPAEVTEKVDYRCVLFAPTPAR